MKFDMGHFVFHVVFANLLALLLMAGLEYSGAAPWLRERGFELHYGWMFVACVGMSIVWGAVISTGGAR